MRKEDIIRQLAISSDLQREFMRQPAHFAEYAFLHARAQDNVRKLEETLDLVFSDLYAEARERIADAKENDCKAYIRSRTLYKEAQRQLRRAKHTADVLRATVRAFEMRRDMLIQLGAQFRAELDSTDLRTREARQLRTKANRVIRRTYEKKKGRK